jgi:hypothetical protein
MKIKIIEAIRLINEKNRKASKYYGVKYPYKGHAGKKIELDDELRIATLAIQGKKIKDIYNDLDCKYHYETVSKYVHKYRIDENISSMLNTGEVSA